jgi:hypothetical protein
LFVREALVAPPNQLEKVPVTEEEITHLERTYTPELLQLQSSASHIPVHRILDIECARFEFGAVASVEIRLALELRSSNRVENVVSCGDAG